MSGPGLYPYLLASAALFCAGVYGVLTRRTLLGILIGVELMLAAGSLNLLAFAWHTVLDLLEPPWRKA